MILNYFLLYSLTIHRRDSESFFPNQFMLYPNPAEDAILLSWKELASSAQIDILDVYGRTLIVLKDQLLNAAPVEIDISGLTPGIYFVNVRAKNGRNEQQKFIKK